ncbi:MAG: hypothetical protein E7177_06525 [Erysipelotrichaceae bacterium]|nr:hypothetical protein [Erysipelotrichaceae bacterium]
MDKFFIAIGRFFKKIWEWIKSTAWVQPLLIVAVIFGIIFSINPIADAIKEAVEADDTGEFYEEHNVKYNELYVQLPDQSPKYYKDVENGKKILTENSGTVIVIYLDSGVSAGIENEIAAFYKNIEKTETKFYIVDFASEENSNSTWNEDEKEYSADAGKVYYNHLLDEIYSAYNDDAWRGDYNEAFENEYGYSVLYNGLDSFETNETSPDLAANDLTLPLAVKYENGKIADMRFGTWTSYSKTITKSNNEILQDMWKGVSK